MKEYIEREALLDALYDNEFQTYFPLDEISGVIDNAPTADVVEVRHGEWVEKDNEVYCSECHKHALLEDDGKGYQWHISKSKSNYCPNCGAKMDGKGE